MNKPRLIDANELYKAVSDGKYTTGNIFKDMELQDFIKSMPTAYDIDKVVERLEELIQGCEEVYADSIALGDLQMRTASRNQAIALKQAIEIVKGGADNDR